MTNTTSLSFMELWNIVKKEITGIQLLWETVNGLYFQPRGKGLATLGQEVPTLFRLTQTVLMESLQMRVSRLMDPANSGSGSGKLLPDHEVLQRTWQEAGHE